MQERDTLINHNHNMTCKNLINITRQLLSIAVVLFFFSACKETNSEIVSPSTPQSRVIEGKIFKQDSLKKAVVVKAGTPRVVVVKKEPIKKRKGNIIQAGTPTKLKIENSNIITPGKEGIPIPIVTVINEKVVTTLPPERIEAKNAYFRDRNPFNFSSIGKLQGLRHDQIRAMTEDTFGNLWLGTDDGLTKYDGRYLYHYTTQQGLSNSLILSVLHDSKGNIWAGTFRGGAVKFDGQEFHIFTSEDGLPSDIVNWIEEDSSGNIWMATGGGVVKYDGESITVYTEENGLCDNDARFLMIDRYGKLWITTNLGGISRFDGESFTNFTKNEGLPQDEATALCEDRKGNIWIGLSTMGLIKFDGSSFYLYNNDSGLEDGGIRSIMEDWRGNLWIGTTRSGLLQFDGNSFINYSIDEGLNSEYIRCLHEDRSGNIWIGTRSAGLVRYKGDLFTHRAIDDGLSNSRVMSILEDTKGTLWLGTFGGYISLITDRKNQNGDVSYSLFGPNQGLNSSRIYSIIETPEGKIWLGTDGGGITQFDGQRSITYTTKEGLCDNTIRDIAQTASGELWIASYGGGASLFNGKSFSNYSTSNGLSSNNIMAIHEDSRGIVWFATDGGGITLFNGEEFTHYTTNEGFCCNVVYSIAEDDNGDIWIGTGGEGVLRFDGEKFTHYSIKEGLNNEYVLSLLKDSKGNIWAGTRYGINRISKDPSRNEYKIRSYNYEEGFIGMGCNLGAIEELSNGEIIVGTTDRLTKFHGDKEPQSGAPFTMQLTNLLVFNEEIPWVQLNSLKDSLFQLKNGLLLKNIKISGISRWNNIPIDLELPHKLNYITFKFIAVTQNEIAKVRYEYMLDGLDKTWNNASTVTEIPYVNLSPGRYSFKVRATSSEGKRSEEVTYNFRIKPPWWQTYWFYVLLFSLFILFFYLFIKYRERILKRDKELLELKVQEQTEELLLKNNELEVINMEKDKLFSVIAHDLRGPFGTFLGLTQIMSEDFSSFTEKELRSFAENMNSTAKNLFNLLENLLHWAKMQRQAVPFNPVEIELKYSIIDNLGWVSDSAKKKGISLIIDIPEDLKIVADESMLQTIIRNIVSNSVKFTPEGGEVSIKSIITDGIIEIIVKDSGIGMDEELKNNIFKLGNKSGRSGTDGEPSTGLGLIICKELVELHKGTILVESSPKNGSKFIIRLPIKQERD